jgi:carboxylesterase
VKGALVLHGFTGDPWEVAPLAEALRAEGFRVEAPRLPGHDGDPESLERATVADWLVATRDAFDRLAGGGGPVCVAGLSMGALLALYLAAERSPAVAALSLMSTPLRLIGKARLYAWMLGRVGVRPRWRFAKKGPRDVTDAAAAAGAPHTPLIPARALLEFERLRRAARAALPRVVSPTLVVHARHDHTAWPGGVAWLERGLKGSVEVLWLARSYHLVTVDVERDQVARAVCGFFGRHSERVR